MRRKKRAENKNGIKNILYVWGAVLAISIIAFIITFISYSNKLKSSSNDFSMTKIAELVPNTTQTEEIEQASTQVGKTVEESKNEITNTQNKVEQTNSIKENTIKTDNNLNTKEEKTNTTSTNNTKTQTTTQTTTKPQKVEDPTFVYPVEGEVTNAFAKENLIYSETLKEWVTHNGIDIKAEKATIVKAAADGTVTSIKNDPRYGTTVIIEHVNGFVTRYSNLLTSEFVTVGEKVEKGQTIGTVGNSAAFEIADEAHLHFEILKDNVNLDPALYLK